MILGESKADELLTKAQNIKRSSAELANIAQVRTDLGNRDLIILRKKCDELILKIDNYYNDVEKAVKGRYC